MREFTFGELKQGLVCCTVYKNCSGCPCFRGPEEGPEEDCTYKLMSAAMNCINIMEADLDTANGRAARWEETATRHEQEIIRIYESFDKR